MGPILFTFPSTSLSTEKFKKQNQNNKKLLLNNTWVKTMTVTMKTLPVRLLSHYCVPIGRQSSYRSGLESGWQSEDHGQQLHKQSSQPLFGLQFPLLLNEEVSLDRRFIIMLPGALGFLQRAGERNEK